MRSVLLAVFYLMMAHSSHAQTFYRCMSAQGQPVFSEQPCSGLQAERVESLNCRKARKDLDAAANFGDFRRNDLPARRSAMYSACGMKAPQVTIINPTPATSVSP
jgi:hypothetical protein